MRLLPLVVLSLVACSTSEPDPGGDPRSGDPLGTAGDSAAGDPAGSGMWQGCPTAADYVGDTWGLALEIDPGARFCNQGDESQTLASEFLRKTMVRIAPGSFAIPDVSIDPAVPFTLPVCFAFAHGDAPVLDGTGEVRAFISPSGSDEFFNIMVRQPLMAGSQPWDLRLDIAGMRAAGQSVVVADGSMASDEFGFGLVTMQLCRGTDCYSSADQFRTISACDYSALPKQNHHIEFTDGSRTGILDLDIHIGFSPASTEPAMFVLGSGNIGGVTFSQNDFWQLFYRPTHHHFSRDFGLLFEAPIGAACGVAVTELMGKEAVLNTTDCDLNSLATSWTITDSTWTQP
jgi:hypothetical protein